MHEDTQRRLVRTAFILLCVLPTLICAGIAIYCALPYSQRSLERRLSRDLGIDVRVGKMTAPRPRQLRLTEVRLLDHETQTLLISFPRVDLANTDQGWRIRFGEGWVDGAGLRSLWSCLRHRIMPQENFTKQIADIAGQKLNLQLGATTFELHHFVWASLSAGADHKSVIEFYPQPTADRKQTQPIQLLLERDRSEQPVRTQVVLETGPHQIPLRVLSLVSSSDKTPSGSFRGNLPIEWRQDQWTARILGDLTEIDLAAAATDWLPRPIAGTAALKSINAKFDASGLRRADGKLHVESLSLEQTLLNELLKLRLLSAGPAFASWASGIAAEAKCELSQLDVEFSISEGGFACIGAHGEGEKVAVDSPQGALFFSHGLVTTADLVRALVPRDSMPNAYELADRWQHLLPPTVPYLGQSRASAQRASQE